MFLSALQCRLLINQLENLGISKVFDSVYHRLLIQKLKAKGITDIVVNLIESFLKERTFNVSINVGISPSKAAVSSVPALMYSSARNSMDNGIFVTMSSLYKI